MTSILNPDRLKFGFALTRFTLTKIVRKLKRLGKGKKSGDIQFIHMQLLMDAARRLGVEVEELGFGVFEFRHENKRHRMHYLLRNDCDNALSFWLCAHKYLVFQILKKNGIDRVPYGELYTLDTMEKARKDFLKRGKTVVVKPCFGTSSGKGITVGIKTVGELNRAAYNALLFDDNFLMEDFISGEHFRFLFFKGKMLSILKRIPANITGDGKHTIRELISLENRKRISGNLEIPLYPIPMDEEVKLTMKNNGMDLDVVPEDGQIIFVKSVANFNSGGEVEEATDEVHPEIIDYCRKIVDVVDVAFCGIDVIAEHIRNPMDTSGMIINEVNTSPGVEIHYRARNIEKRKDIATEIIRLMFDI